jgi:hypothetical protein
MCPFCISSAVWIAAGTTSMGGIAAVVVSKLRGKNNKKQHGGQETHEHQEQ